MTNVAAQSGQYVILQTRVASGALENLGVVLVDPATGQAGVRLRRDLDRIAGDDEDREYLELLTADLEAKAAEMGGAALLDWMESTLSNFIETSDRENVLLHRFDDALYRLYRKYIDAETRPFRTHLPRYSLRAAAGRFGAEGEPGEEPDGWEEAPAGLRLSEGMFVVEIEGRSMEPLLPDGCRAVFRAGVAGSRAGRILLVEQFSDIPLLGRYTVKRYTSVKRATGDGGWEHAAIRLEPLNPEFEPWDLPAEQVRVVAEFVCLLEASQYHR